MGLQTPNPGALIRIRSTNWKVRAFKREAYGSVVSCRATSGVAKGKTARFVLEMEKDYAILAPQGVELIPDSSPGFIDAKLFLEAAFRNTPTAAREPLTLGKAAIDDLSFQHAPVKAALRQDRVRLLVADDVGLGKTLEAGLIASELVLRGRADRMLVVTTRSMLNQFQKEFWTRFSIPLSRLDSAAIRRMRNQIPAHYNVFDQFDRAIVSIDTLKRDGRIRAALEESFWDLIIIDEAHNAARRAKSGGDQSLRSQLARLLARKADSLLLLTATPHDGSQDSFASLIEMLDPTRIPVAQELRRKDIEDLVVRRFRSSPEVIAALKGKTPKRLLKPRRFPLGAAEEEIHRRIAELRLKSDEGRGKVRAMDLFRTTLAKAVFSSPAACLETVERRLRKSDDEAADRAQLEELAALLREVGPEDFSKYQDLLAMLREAGWRGKDKRDRLVIFSERLRTVAWLEARLKIDLGFSDEMIGRIDGGGVEADESAQETLENFAQENKPIRILIASDMASEGLNLHFQSHRLIHFDLPWSLLRFQQRNGRIDRYGQDRRPEITYFIGESAHPKVRDMWVLEKLAAKDEAAQEGVGDPAVFLGAGHAELEEEVVAEAVASGLGPEAFEREMDARAAQSAAGPLEAEAFDAAFDALFGGYDGAPAEAPAPAPLPAPAAKAQEASPRLYPDAFAYAAAMLGRLNARHAGLLSAAPKIDPIDRLIEFPLPEDMTAQGGFGYARSGDVDEKYMPVEAIGREKTIRLTDRKEVVNKAVEQARAEERPWPNKQFLWDGHPILDWFADRAEIFFPDRTAPFCALPGRLAPGEICVLLHGAAPNEAGAPLVDLWSLVVLRAGEAPRVETPAAFIARTRLNEPLPNPEGRPETAAAQAALAEAVEVFQTHLVATRKAREAEIVRSLDETLQRLSALEARFHRQIEMDLGEDPALTPALRSRRERRRDQRRQDVRSMFEDWSNWFKRHRTMVEDPNPHVEIKAVFAG